MEAPIVALFIGLIMGGSLKNLSRLQFSYIPLIVAAYLIQVGIDFWAPEIKFGLFPVLHIVSYLMLMFALLKNRGLPGTQLMLAGTFLNFIVILFNGGFMPVKAELMADYTTAALAGTHGVLDSTTRLDYLADVIFLPLSYHPRLVSLGDLIINLGLLVLIVKGMKARRPEVGQTP